MYTWLQAKLVLCTLYGPHVLPDFVDELASDEDEINEDDVQYIEGLAQKVCI